MKKLIPSSRLLRLLFVLSGLIALAVFLIPGAGTSAQVVRGEELQVTEEPFGVEHDHAEIAAPRIRKPAQMRRMDARLNPPESREEEEFLRPTIDESEYFAIKAAGAARNALALGPAMGRVVGRGGPDSLAVPGTGTLDPEPLAPPAVLQSCEGDTRTDFLRPPDPHMAVGPSHVLQITNSRINVFRKSDCLNLLSISLNAFFGYTPQLIFDPQAVYDFVSDRWIVTGEAFEESATVQRFFMGVSTSSNPVGSYFIFNSDVNFFNNDDFFDYPHIGQDHDSILVTANIFGPTTFRGAQFFAWPKLELFAGKGFSYCFFRGLVGTTMPSNVLDRNPDTFLLAAPPAGSVVTKYRVVSSSRLCPSIFVSSIAVPFYLLPPDASQPGVNAKLSTLDGRFVNMGTQIGNALYQVHSVDVAGLSTPRLYIINSVTNAVTVEDFFWTNTSHDWNASVAANFFGDIFVNWSSTDTGGRGGGGTNAQVRFGGRRAGTVDLIRPGAALFTSPNPYATFACSIPASERWGDYSSVAIDPVSGNGRTAWFVNQKNQPAVTPPCSNRWGTRIGGVTY